ncbi:hypothetical protein F3Y22_tig00110333pilonHSYRG00030 [Hibiscus syriacus]|uniref:Uncharacterized protein n=1 Tax=Hibiscus syriacus TaxID=106335 RepID=A0A6A3AYX1_HIBSY|nr:hypothetical protein F3Y22_tig00110333pilonHSYRG00030 [Hibiscus syriacus]
MDSSPTDDLNPTLRSPKSVAVRRELGEIAETLAASVNCKIQPPRSFPRLTASIRVLDRSTRPVAAVTHHRVRVGLILAKKILLERSRWTEPAKPGLNRVHEKRGLVRWKYDLGRKKNFEQVFGTKKSLWFFPLFSDDDLDNISALHGLEFPTLSDVEA